MSILPFILKNPQNGTMDSTKEIRMFYAPTDKSEFNDGYIYKNSKKELKFNGISVRYDDVQLVVKKVVVGKGCNLNLLKKIKEICEEQNVKMLILEK